jgi:endonuclease/exonuclease/phosphatase (EEP) superfamily protein YafD
MRFKWLIAFVMNAMIMGLAFSLNTTTRDSVIHVMGYSKIEKLNGHHLKVLVWNMKKAEDARFVTDFKKISSEYDLILLQEGIFSQEYIDPYLQSKWHEVVVAKSFYLPFSKRQEFTGLATFAKAHSIKNDYVKTHVTEPIVNTPKMSLITNYAIKDSDQTLMVINIHAVNFVSASDFKKELSRLYDAVKHHNGPIILAGDFNTWSAKRLASVTEMINKLELKEVTIPFKYRETGLRLVLDHMFVRSANVVRIDNMSAINSSDHEPLAVTLDIR